MVAGNKHCTATYTTEPRDTASNLLTVRKHCFILTLVTRWHKETKITGMFFSNLPYDNVLSFVFVPLGILKRRVSGHIRHWSGPESSFLHDRM